MTDLVANALALKATSDSINSTNFEGSRLGDAETGAIGSVGLTSAFAFTVVSGAFSGTGLAMPIAMSSKRSAAFIMPEAAMVNAGIMVLA